MEKPGESVKITRRESPVCILTNLSEDQQNVVLVLDNNVRKSSHIFYLSASPILKEILLNIEVRLEKSVVIFLPGFSEKSVVDLLKFLHHGSVGMII